MRTENFMVGAGRFSRVLIALSTVALLTGCSDRLETYPVAGRVQFKSGGAVHVGTIELKSREHDVQARGSINTDGTFELTTYEPGDGAVAGMHDCVLVQLVVTEDLANHKPSAIGVVDRRYNSYASSDLEIEVKPQQSNEILLEVDGILEQQPADEHHH